MRKDTPSSVLQSCISAAALRRDCFRIIRELPETGTKRIIIHLYKPVAVVSFHPIRKDEKQALFAAARAVVAAARRKKGRPRREPTLGSEKASNL